jgi:hypothetical protein
MNMFSSQDPLLDSNAHSLADEALGSEPLLSRLFSPDVVLKFDNVRADALTHSFSPIRYTAEGREIRIDDAQKLLASISLWGRIDDRVLDHGPGYIFRVDTGLSSDEIVARFQENAQIDRGEHRSFHFIPYAQHDIRSFIERYYRGAVVSDTARPNERQRLLHPAALVLAGVGEIPLSELSSLYSSSE